MCAAEAAAYGRSSARAAAAASSLALAVDGPVASSAVLRRLANSGRCHAVMAVAGCEMGAAVRAAPGAAAAQGSAQDSNRRDGAPGRSWPKGARENLVGREWAAAGGSASLGELVGDSVGRGKWRPWSLRRVVVAATRLPTRSHSAGSKMSMKGRSLWNGVWRRAACALDSPGME